MDWIDKLDSKNARAWEELMVDYLYDLDDWNEARVQLLQLLKNDQRNASESDLRAYLSCCAESAVLCILYLTLRKLWKNFIPVLGWKTVKRIEEQR